MVDVGTPVGAVCGRVGLLVFVGLPGVLGSVDSDGSGGVVKVLVDVDAVGCGVVATGGVPEVDGRDVADGRLAPVARGGVADRGPAAPLGAGDDVTTGGTLTLGAVVRGGPAATTPPRDGAVTPGRDDVTWGHDGRAPLVGCAAGTCAGAAEFVRGCPADVDCVLGAPATMSESGPCPRAGGTTGTAAGSEAGPCAQVRTLSTGRGRPSVP